MRQKAILEKNKGEFPRQISDQRYNEYIKKVCKEAGLTALVYGSKMDKKTKRKVTGMFPKHELCASHIGRRSYATNNFGRVPTSLLRYVTGHSSEGMLLSYLGKSDVDQAVLLAEHFDL